MASGERRLGSGRRGMTVLGKIPTPSVPKPINLPSQRLENRGLEPTVELVPRGTFSWGSAGRSNAVAVSKEGGSGIGTSPPTSSVAWNGALKMQDLSTSSNDAGSLADSNRPLSAGSTRPSSAPTAATTSVWDSNAKTKVKMQVPTSGFTVNRVEPGSQENADVTPQPKNVPSNRPTTADGTVLDRDMNPHPDVNAHANAGSRPGSGSEGFQHPGDGYNGQRNHHHLVWQGVPPAGSHELPVVPGPYSGPMPHDVYYRPFGLPQHGNVKDRDMMVVRMVNCPGVYGSFPPHFRPAECFGPPGTLGSYQPAARHVEQFAMSGNSAIGASPCTPGMSFGFFPDSNKYLFQEGDGLFGTVPRDGGYTNVQRDVDSIRHISSVPSYGTEWNHRMSRPFGRHNHSSGEHGNYAKDAVASFAVPVPEKKITLLTKVPRVEVPSTETITNSSTLLDNNQGKEGGQQKTVMSKIEAENVSRVLEVKDAKKADESLESKKLDGSVAKTSTRDMAGEIKHDAVAVNCSKDNLVELETGVSKTFPSRSPKTWRKAAGRSEVNGPSSAQKSLTSINTQDLEWKAQMNHHFKSDVDSQGRKISKRAHEGAHSSSFSESVGTGSEAVCTEPTKPVVEENISCRDDQKTKTKAFNHKSEKEWRPKSPVVESKSLGLRVSKGGKRNEGACNAESVKEVSSQECSAGSAVLEASSLSQTQKADKRRVFKNLESLSPSASSDINSDKESPFLLIEDSNSSQCQVVEVAVDPSENERIFVLEASYSGVHNTARSTDQVLHADCSKVMVTEGLTFKGNHKAKTRQSNHKGEREWRPKSPAVDSAATSDTVFGSQASEANVTSTSVSDIEIKSTEQEGLQPLDAYDYDGQRAKLKEIAAQRAKQRQKEEEERTKEQRAKALAKLDELNRRTLANPTTVDGVEHDSVVSMDEVPNKKTKRKFNSSRRSSVDAFVYNSGATEKQHIDEEMVQAPVKDSTSISATTAFHKKYPTKVGTDSMELASSDVILSQNSRSKRDEPDRNSLKTAEKRQLHKSPTATSSYQEQRQQSRKEKFVTEEDLLFAVRDTEVESSSSKKFGVEIRKDNARLHGGQRQTDSTQNHTDEASLMYKNERKGTVEEHQELERPKSSSVVSRIGDSQDKGGIPGKAAFRRRQENSVEGQKQMKAGELFYSEEHPFALGSPERKNLINAGGGQQSAGSSHLGQKHRSEMEACFTIEQAQSLGVKQPMESTVSSDASFVSEKLSKPHVSWRQKSLSHLPNSDKPLNGLNKDMGSALEESLGTPTQARKSHKFKNVGGKEYAASRHQGGHIQVEVVEEKRTGVSGAAISEVTSLDADIYKHEVQAKASENVKIGRSHNARRQKNIANGSYIVKQTSMKEFNERCPESSAATEAFEEMVDTTHLHAASTSNLHHPIAHTKQSLRVGIGAPPWHKHRSMKLSNATPSLGQAGSLVPVEEHSPGQVVSMSRNRSRSNMANTQGWETEQLQAEPTLPLEANAQNHKHQQIYLAKGTETVSDQHLSVSSSKNRSNHTHAENRKMNRHYQAGPQTFRPREQHHEAEFETGNNRGEQRPLRGRDKPSRKSQFTGCSTVAEFDRRGAEPVIKTEISY